jgi:hypothetical protein
VRRLEDERPGGSNTRPQTPLPSPILLQNGVDSLQVAYRVSLSEAVLVRLESACRSRKYVLANTHFELKRLGRKFVLANDDVTIEAGPDNLGFEVKFVAHAMFLRCHPLQRVIDAGETFVKALAGSLGTEVRVRRVDLFADAAGVAFDADDLERMVSRSRTGVHFHAPNKVFRRRKKHELHCTGFMVSPGNPILVRAYDKTEELLQQHGLESAKTRTEHANFSAAGWDGVSPVWRVEAQFRSEVLQRQGVHTPSQLLERLNALWTYALGAPGSEEGWLRLVVANSATRSERSKVDSRWELYRGASFEGGGEPLVREDGNRAGVSLEQMIGSVVSFLGATGNLRQANDDEPAESLIESDFARAAKAACAKDEARKKYPSLRSAKAARRSSIDVNGVASDYSVKGTDTEVQL